MRGAPKTLRQAGLLADLGKSLLGGVRHLTLAKRTAFTLNAIQGDKNVLPSNARVRVNAFRNWRTKPAHRRSRCSTEHDQ
jgi:hypothetical protein